MPFTLYAQNKDNPQHKGEIATFETLEEAEAFAKKFRVDYPNRYPKESFQLRIAKVDKYGRRSYSNR